MFWTLVLRLGVFNIELMTACIRISHKKYPSNVGYFTDLKTTILLLLILQSPLTTVSHSPSLVADVKTL